MTLGNPLNSEILLSLKQLDWDLEKRISDCKHIIKIARLGFREKNF